MYEPLKLYQVEVGGKKFFLQAVSKDEAWELVVSYIAIWSNTSRPRDIASVVEIPPQEGFWSFDKLF